LPGFLTQNIGIGDEIAVDRSWQLDCHLGRSVVGEGAEFELGHV
jgi:hypothetical protein